MTRRKLTALCMIAVVALVASSCKKTNTTKTSEGKKTDEYASTSLGDKTKDYLEAESQETNGSKIVIKDVVLAAPGYVVIHKDDGSGGVSGEVIEASKLLTAGEHKDLVIDLMSPLTSDQKVHPMLHVEANGNTAYDGVEVDPPVSDGKGNVIVLDIDLEIKT